MSRRRIPDASVEHIGSTAVSSYDGNGVVDLILLCTPGRLAEARDTLDHLGVQRHVGPNAFPEERPVRIGSLQHDGQSFGLHVHVIAADSSEADEQRRFRHALRGDPSLVAEYVAQKRAVLSAGVADSDAYNRGKESLIRAILDGPAGADRGR